MGVAEEEGEEDVLGELEEGVAGGGAVMGREEGGAFDGGVGGEVAGVDELFAGGLAVGVDEVFEGETVEAEFAEAFDAGGALGDGYDDLAEGSGV